MAKDTSKYRRSDKLGQIKTRSVALRPDQVAWLNDRNYNLSALVRDMIEDMRRREKSSK